MNHNDTELLKEKLIADYGKDKTDKLISYIDMVLDRNRFINLTAIRDRDEAMQKHLADSLAIVSLPEYIESENIIDIGTGAGFPGALLAIVSPEKNFTLLDSTLKRLKVIDEFAGELGISNIRTVHARAEEISRKPECNQQFDMCVSRAVASLDKLSGWCLPFVRTGGVMAAYKGDNYESEVNESMKSLSKYRGKLVRAENAGLTAEGMTGHVILVIRKY